jgi:hypothetical protein
MEPLLVEAVKLHEQGDIDAADNLYRRILDAFPYNAHALHFRGVVAVGIKQKRTPQQKSKVLIRVFRRKWGWAGKEKENQWPLLFFLFFFFVFQQKIIFRKELLGLVGPLHKILTMHHTIRILERPIAKCTIVVNNRKNKI